MKYIYFYRKNKKLVNPTAKRFCYPRFIGDLRREDFTSRESWEVLEKFLNLNKTKISTLTKKVTRLQRKVESMKDLLSHLKGKNIVSKEVVNSLEVCKQCVHLKA